MHLSVLHFLQLLTYIVFRNRKQKGGEEHISMCHDQEVPLGSLGIFSVFYQFFKAMAIGVLIGINGEQSFQWNPSH